MRLGQCSRVRAPPCLRSRERGFCSVLNTKRRSSSSRARPLGTRIGLAADFLLGPQTYGSALFFLNVCTTEERLELGGELLRPDVDGAFAPLRVALFARALAGDDRRGAARDLHGCAPAVSRPFAEPFHQDTRRVYLPEEAPVSSIPPVMRAKAILPLRV